MQEHRDWEGLATKKGLLCCLRKAQSAMTLAQSTRYQFWQAGLHNIVTIFKNSPNLSKQLSLNYNCVIPDPSAC